MYIFLKTAMIYFTILPSTVCLHFRINTQRKPIIRKQTEAIEENDSVLEKLWSGDRRLVFYKFMKPFLCTDVESHSTDVENNRARPFVEPKIYCL